MHDLCWRWQCRARNGFHLLKPLHLLGYRKILEAPTSCISFCLTAALPFSNLGEIAGQVWCLVPGESSGKALEPRGMVSAAQSHLAQLSWTVTVGHRMKRRGRTEWSIPRRTGICLLSWVFLSPFFPQLFGLTAALPWVLLSLMASRSSWAASLHQEGLSLCLYKGSVQALPLSETFLFRRNWLVFRP